MKASLSVVVCSIVLSIMMPSAIACATDKKEIRNDRVSVSKSIPQFDINPFTDSKRVVRNDHISYSHPKVEADQNAETTTSQKRRYIRNDHVIITK